IKAPDAVLLSRPCRFDHEREVVQGVYQPGRLQAHRSPEVVRVHNIRMVERILESRCIPEYSRRFPREVTRSILNLMTFVWTAQRHPRVEIVIPEAWIK